ncbi:MAG: SDR family oxidoreductase [Bacteriovoracaceae bacterium]|jgi:pteridine reductase|nr:SDR family oxidoreductase [Bacteriovoracaceae bacterium]
MEASAALVTGASRRIGREIALKLAKDGHNLALHYNNSLSSAEELRDEISKMGRKCEIFRADLNSHSQRSKLIENVFSEFKTLSILVNNASSFEPCDFLQTTEKDFDDQFGINFKAPFFLTQSFVKKADSGVIINMLDTRVFRNDTDFFIYNLSKKSLHQLTKMLARELAPKFRVHGLCLGPILAPSYNGPSEDLATLKRNTPMEKVGTPSDIARILSLLAHEPLLTGICLPLDGGESLLY